MPAFPASGPGSLSAAQPPGVEEGWFTPTGPFLLYRDGGTGTLALMHRALGETGAGDPTGDVLSTAGAQPGEVGGRGSIQFRLVLASGTGPVAYRARW